jgi:hypothetical protein
MDTSTIQSTLEENQAMQRQERVMGFRRVSGSSGLTMMTDACWMALGFEVKDLWINNCPNDIY